MINTNSIKTLIIDESKQSVRFISSTLKSTFPNFEVVEVSPNLSDGLMQIERLQPDLIFLNFDMINFNDHNQLDLISKYMIPLIFVSKYAQHAQYAIKHSPIDYLVYPFSVSDLNLALERVEKSNKILNTN